MCFSSQFAIILITVMCVSVDAGAYSRVVAHGAELRQLEVAVLVYQDTYGAWPVSDSQSSWFEKLAADGLIQTNDYKLTPDGKLPLGHYGDALVYELPNQSNGQRVVFRDIGENRIDDQGQLDDWDTRFGPHSGYWYKKSWPAARNTAWGCGFFALLGLVVIHIKLKQYLAKFVYASVWVGIMFGIALPLIVGRGRYAAYYGRTFPDWLDDVIGFGVFFLTIGTLLLVIHIFYTIRCRRQERMWGHNLCEACGYDLRGTVSANIDRCPECGHQVSVFQNRKFNPPSP